MATMANGLKTWLKQDCVNAGEDIMSSLNVLEGLSNLQKYIHDPDVKEKLGTTGINGYIDLMTTDVSSRLHAAVGLMDDESKSKVTNYIAALKQFSDNKNELEYGNVLHELRGLIIKQSFERVVECQCGKQIITAGSHIRVKVGNTLA